MAYLNLSDYNMALASSETVTFLGILAVCVLAPVAEEIVMRGGIEENLLQWKKNPAIAILVSSLLFAVLHLSPSLIIGTFFLGLISGWVYYRTRNVMVCIFMHMSNNIISCLSDWLLPDSISLTDDIYVKLLVFVCVAIVVIAIMKFNESTKMLKDDSMN